MPDRLREIAAEISTHPTAFFPFTPDIRNSLGRHLILRNRKAVAGPQLLSEQSHVLTFS
jgi:hypothetical protein